MSDAEIYANPDPVTAIAMLVEAGLPTGDLGATDWSHFLASGPRKAPEGLVGLELLGKVALLRSLIVGEQARGRGLGAALVRAAEAHAANEGVQTLFLLTETAERFFAVRGYQPVARETVPADIVGTREFSELCPENAVVMCKQLGAAA
ncbi:MAG: arsenic resistance N-acetyltransferase ArsN2 [Pseudomonadota bacterium]